LPDIADRLRQLPVPVVIDHMGGFDVAAGTDEAGFRCLRALLGDGKAWLKICAYRNLLTAPDAEAGRPFHRALLAANPEHLVWGTDWPHLRVVPEPDTQALLDQFKRWTDDDALVQRVLVTNPAALYD
jgi:predicted TIM-barrel fold metal-dependent hydrolase